MTLTTTTSRADYNGNGSTTAFPVPFRFLQNADLRVIHKDGSGVETVLVLNTDYTVAGAGAATGTVTLTDPLPNGYGLTILRVVVPIQAASFRNQGTFYPEVHEDALDLLTMVAQQQEEREARTVMLPETSTGVNPTFPTPVPGAAIGWNGDGDGLGNLIGAGSGTIEDARDLTLADLASTADPAKGDALVGVKPTGAQVGVTQHLLNEPIVKPEMFGAVAGTGLTGAQRTTNTTAINAAIQAIIGTGTLDLRGGPYEVNGSIVIGTNSYQLTTRTAIVGNGDEKSKIIGYLSDTTQPILDAVGSRLVTMSGITVYAATEARYGLQIARSTVQEGAQGWVIDNCRFLGTYGLAPLATLAVEVIRPTNCEFSNKKVGGYSYMTGTVPSAAIPMTSTAGWTVATDPLLCTNTDIKFYGCTFFGDLDGGSHNGMYFETQFEGVFTNCQITSYPPSAVNTVKLVQVTPTGAVSPTFIGKLLFESCHFEMATTAGTSYMFWFNNPNSLYSVVQGVDVVNCHFVFEPAASFVGTAYPTYCTLQLSNWTFNMNQASRVLYLPKLNLCYIEASNCPVWLYDTNNSRVFAGSVTWQPNSQSYNSLIVDRFSHANFYGCTPVQANNANVPSTFSGANSERVVLSPVIMPSPVPFRGEVSTIDLWAGWLQENSIAEDGDVFQMFDGEVWKPIGAYRGTPLNASGTSGARGTVLFDDSYIYVCTSSGTNGAAIGGALAGVTGTIALGSNALALNTVPAVMQSGNFNSMGRFLSVAGLDAGAAQQILSIDVPNKIVYLAKPASAGVTGAAVTWATPVWRRAALATW